MLTFKVLSFVLCVCVLAFSSAAHVHARRTRAGSGTHGHVHGHVHGRLETKLGYVHSHSTSMPYSDQPYKIRIDEAAGNEYLLPRVIRLHHCTNLYFDQFRPRATWFSLDVTEGFKMVLQKAVAGEKAKPITYTQGQVSQAGTKITGHGEGVKFDRDMIGGKITFNQDGSSVIITDVISETELQTAAPRTLGLQGYNIKYGADGHVYCRVAQPTVTLKLFLMKRTEELSRAGIRALSPSSVSDLSWLNQPWYHNTAASTAGFVTQFCALATSQGYDGWRNPWDQDEIMICPQSLNKVRLLPETRFCPSEVASVLIAPVISKAALILADTIEPVWDARSRFWITSATDPVGAETSRFHFLAFHTKPAVSRPGSTWDKTVLQGGLSNMAAHEQSLDLFESVCCAFSSITEIAERKNRIDKEITRLVEASKRLGALLKSDRELGGDKQEILKKHQQRVNMNILKLNHLCAYELSIPN